MGLKFAGTKNGARALILGSFYAVLLSIVGVAGSAPAASGNPDGDAFRVDIGWPQPLPNKWIIGDVGGVSVDKHNHVWIVHRPGTLSPNDVLAGKTPPTAKCCVAAPPVLEFDTDGKLLRGWGGQKAVENWFESEHSIFVDDEDHVWIVGAGRHDGQLMKFTMDGKLLLRIGRKGDFVAADDPTMLGMPTDVYVDTKRREVYVSDGYRNHRVIVFDADSGAFKRQWTAFGKKVDPAWSSVGEEIGSRGPHLQFDIFTTVHCVTMIGDEVFVCDRSNNRLQIFRPNGTFIREIFFNRDWAVGAGATWDAAPVPGNPDRIFVLDGTNSEIAVLDTHSGAVLGHYLAKGHFVGQMHWPHQLAADQQGRLYVAEVDHSARIQRFMPNTK